MNRVSMVLACAAMLFAVQPAASEDASSSELAEMRELVQGLKQKVDAQAEELEHQGQLLEQAQSVAREQQEEGTGSGLSSFVDSIAVTGHVAGSWFYDFDSPSGPNGGRDINNGQIGTMPFHPDHNSFTVDQIWFGVGKEATEESRAGFQFDILMGNAANFLGQGTGFESNPDTDAWGRFLDNDRSTSSPIGRRSTALDSVSDYYIAQAYVEYQCGCFGPEINFVFGKRQTDVGAEVVQSGGNFNITLGNVYQFTQPVDHLGLWATVPFGDMVELTLGIMNDGGSTLSAPDLNKEKSYEASLLVGDDKMNVRTTFIYGANQFDPDNWSSDAHENSLRSGLADVTAWYNPTESLSTWVNYTYTYVEGSRAMAHGVALAGRAQVTEKISAALRGEYVRIKQPKDGVVGGSGFGATPGIDFEPIMDNIPLNNFNFARDPGAAELYSLTGTVGYALTDHMDLRGEVRFDWMNSRLNDYPFFENRRGGSDNRTVGGVEVVYTF
jgi:hypothetical protein